MHPAQRSVHTLVASCVCGVAIGFLSCVGDVPPWMHTIDIAVFVVAVMAASVAILQVIITHGQLLHRLSEDPAARFDTDRKHSQDQ